MSKINFKGHVSFNKYFFPSKLDGKKMLIIFARVALSILKWKITNKLVTLISSITVHDSTKGKWIINSSQILHHSGLLVGK